MRISIYCVLQEAQISLFMKGIKKLVKEKKLVLHFSSFDALKFRLSE